MAAPSSRAAVVLDADVRLVASTGETTLGGGRLPALLPPEPPRQTDSTRGPPQPFVDGPRRLEQGGGASRSRRPKRLSDWAREGAIRAGTAGLVRAPAVSALSLHFLQASTRDIVTQITGVTVKSAGDGLLVLSTGTGSLYESHPSSGCYLVHDAAAADADAVFLAPPIDCGFSLNPEIFGRRPVVLRTGEGAGDFVLALVAMTMSTQQYYLLTWSPAWSTNQQWTCKAVRLPDDVVQYPFMTDVAFAFGDGGGGRRLACWVDLHLGVLTCDVLSADPKFQLVLLPEDYVMDNGAMVRGRPDGHSTMGCVDGRIKYVYMDGFVDEDGVPEDQVTIGTWTLMGQLHGGSCTWVRDDHTALSCGDLWADESFLAVPGLPKLVPTLPVLSPSEPDVVYFFLMSDYVNGGHVKTRGEWVLGLNLRTKKAQTWSKCPPGRILRPCPYFIATELYRPPRESSNLDG